MGLVEASYSIGQKVEYYSEARGPTAALLTWRTLIGCFWSFCTTLLTLRSKMLEEKNNLRIRLVGGPPHVEAQ